MKSRGCALFKVSFAIVLGQSSLSGAVITANADQAVCRPASGSPQDQLDPYMHVIDCPDTGTDPDKIPYTNLDRWRRLDPTGLGSTSEVVMYGGKSTNRAANYGIRAYMADSVRADKKLYERALVFYRRLDVADSFFPKDHSYSCPIESPATSKYDAWTEAKDAAGGDPYQALKIMAIFGHDNMAHGLEPDILADRSTRGCSDRLDRLNNFSPRMDSYLYRDNAIAGRAYDPKDVEEGQRLAHHCAAAYNDKDCGNLSYRCNDGHSSYQADYYHVILSAFAGCRARKYSVNMGTFKAKLEAEKFIAKQYKFLRFAEELRVEPSDSEKTVLPEMRRALDYAYQDPDCALPTDLKFNGVCSDIARATAEREAFEMCFRARQHALGFDFGYNLAGCQ